MTNTLVWHISTYKTIDQKQQPTKPHSPLPLNTSLGLPVQGELQKARLLFLNKVERDRRPDEVPTNNTDLL